MSDRGQIITTAAASFVIGWLAGAMLTGWVAIVAWVLAVFAATLVVYATIDAGFEKERATLRISSEACRRRYRNEREARVKAQERVKLLRAELRDAMEALEMANRVQR